MLKLSAIGVIFAAALVAGEAVAVSCQATYTLGQNSNVKVVAALGQVSATSDGRVDCKLKADSNCAKAKQQLTTYAPVGSAKMRAICDAGSLTVSFQTLIGTKAGPSGTCTVPIACKRTCACTSGWWKENDWCVKTVCALNPAPANDTSFVSTGYFFWGGELRYRTNAPTSGVSCTWTGY